MAVGQDISVRPPGLSTAVCICSSFKLFLELEPQVRDIIFKFYESKYASCLKMLDEMKVRLKERGAGAGSPTPAGRESLGVQSGGCVPVGSSTLSLACRQE